MMELSLLARMVFVKYYNKMKRYKVPKSGNQEVTIVDCVMTFVYIGCVAVILLSVLI